MLATLIDAPFDNKDWVFETKWDGFRLVAKIEKESVTLYSRSGLIVSDNYKPIAKALEKVKKDPVIDGELVALDAHGVSRFQLLQNALNAEDQDGQTPGGGGRRVHPAQANAPVLRSAGAGCA
jgi:bifunctional non-homologous end joining protein LigD